MRRRRARARLTLGSGARPLPLAFALAFLPPFFFTGVTCRQRSGKGRERGSTPLPRLHTVHVRTEHLVAKSAHPCAPVFFSSCHKGGGGLDRRDCVRAKRKRATAIESTDYAPEHSVRTVSDAALSISDARASDSTTPCTLTTSINASSEGASGCSVAAAGGASTACVQHETHEPRR